MNTDVNLATARIELLKKIQQVNDGGYFLKETEVNKEFADELILKCKTSGKTIALEFIHKCTNAFLAFKEAQFECILKIISDCFFKLVEKQWSYGRIYDVFQSIGVSGNLVDLATETFPGNGGNAAKRCKTEASEFNISN
jgi:hypothetical protein